MKKIIALFHIGQDDISEGMNILGAHIDSPRLDVKQNPLYEDTDLAYLDTHYYGGVKKYQWVTLPLAIHGVVVKKDGSTKDAEFDIVARELKGTLKVYDEKGQQYTVNRRGYLEDMHGEVYFAYDGKEHTFTKAEFIPDAGNPYSKFVTANDYEIVYVDNIYGQVSNAEAVLEDGNGYAYIAVIAKDENAFTTFHFLEKMLEEQIEEEEVAYDIYEKFRMLNECKSALFNLDKELHTRN